MTDEQIIRGVEVCINTTVTNCSDCPYCKDKNCTNNLTKDFIDLINRQKAEIERHREHIELLDIEHEAIKISEIKKFIKRFEKKIKDVEFTIGQAWEIKSAIKEVVKEMVGEG